MLDYEADCDRMNSSFEPAHMKRAQLQKLINTEIFADLYSTSSPKPRQKTASKMFFQS